MLAHFGASFWSLDRHTTCDTNWLDFLGHVSTNACRLSPVWNGHICMTCIPLRNGKRLRVLHLLSPTCPDKSDRAGPVSFTQTGGVLSTTTTMFQTNRRKWCISNCVPCPFWTRQSPDKKGILSVCPSRNSFAGKCSQG